MNITIKGTIKNVFPSETFGNFEKRVFWVTEDEGQYPNTFQLEMQQAGCATLDAYKPGDQVDCSVDVKGRHSEKNGKEYVFNTLKCWKIAKVGAVQQPQQTQQSAPAASLIGGSSDIVEDDQLPF